METNLSVLIPRVNKLSQKFDNISINTKSSLGFN